MRRLKILIVEDSPAMRQLLSLAARKRREWRASLDVVPAISALRARAEEIRAAELAKLPALPDGERERLDQVTAQIVAKLLHEPTVRMKEAAADGGGEAYAAAVRRLFGLEEPG